MPRWTCTDLLLALFPYIYLASYSLLPLGDLKPFPLSCHFSINLLFFVRRYYKPQAPTTPLNYSSLSFSYVHKSLLIIFVSLICRALARALRWAEEKVFFSSPPMLLESPNQTELKVRTIPRFFRHVSQTFLFCQNHFRCFFFFFSSFKF